MGLRPSMSTPRSASPVRPRSWVRLRTAALAHLSQWGTGVLTTLKELIDAPDDAKILDARKKRSVDVQQRKAVKHNLIDLWDAPGGAAAGAAGTDGEAVRKFQALYHPIPTRLTTISYEDREEVISCLLLLLLSAGNYTADSRTLIVYLASALELPLAVVIREETEIARSLVEASAAADTQGSTTAAAMSADAETQKRKQDNQSSRYWKVGLASVAGAAIIGVTGGLAAPVVAGAIGGLMGSVGLGGVAELPWHLLDERGTGWDFVWCLWSPDDGRRISSARFNLFSYFVVFFGSRKSNSS